MGCDGLRGMACCPPMRDPARIEELLGYLREAWELEPDQRLGQFLVNLVGPSAPCPEMFGIEDEQLRKRLTRFITSKKSDRSEP